MQVMLPYSSVRLGSRRRSTKVSDSQVTFEDWYPSFLFFSFFLLRSLPNYFQCFFPFPSRRSLRKAKSEVRFFVPFTRSQYKQIVCDGKKIKSKRTYNTGVVLERDLWCEGKLVGGYKKKKESEGGARDGGGFFQRKARSAANTVPFRAVWVRPSRERRPLVSGKRVECCVGYPTRS